MNLKSLFLKIFRGYVVLERVSSKHNGQIIIDEDLFGKKRLLVGGLTQSGKAVEEIWETIIFKLSNCQIANCLILGLGAGNAAKVVNQYFPEAKITGVEIDPEIIKLGKKYFGLKETKDLKIEIKNAFVWLDDCINELIHCNKQRESGFDIVLVDLYIGNSFPKEAEKERFLLSVKKLINQKGLVVFNRLYYQENIQKTDNFQKKLHKIFTNIEARNINYNKLFLCRK